MSESNMSCFDISIKQRSIIFLCILVLSVIFEIIALVYLFKKEGEYVMAYFFISVVVLCLISTVMLISLNNQITEMKKNFLKLILLLISIYAPTHIVIDLYAFDIKILEIILFFIGSTTIYAYVLLIIPNRKVFCLDFSEVAVESTQQSGENLV